MKQHYVEFLSPGTFTAESTRLEINDWNVDRAVEMSGEIHERHGARPYGFRFITRERGPNDMDAKQTASSGMFYLGGEVETLAEVEARDRDDERILLSNMRGNGYERIVTNRNSWKFTQPLQDGDVVLDTPAWAA